MKISKEARKLSRSLFRHSFTDGRLDNAKVAAVVKEIVARKPRHYLDALKDLQRLVRLELERRHAIIESATPLDAAAAAKITGDLKARYGADVTTEFKVTPELIGGLRIQLGSDVWDGSIQGRLSRLDQDLTRAA